MRSTFVQGLRSGMLVVSVAIFTTIIGVSVVSAQTHVVGVAELRKQVLDASRTRQENIRTLSEVIDSPSAQEALHVAHMDPKQVEAAMSTLSDEELGQLAARAAKAKLDFAAGDLSNRDLLLIIAGIAALILIIVAVR